MPEHAFIACKKCSSVTMTVRYYDYGTNEWVYKSTECPNCGGSTGEGRHK